MHSSNPTEKSTAIFALYDCNLYKTSHSIIREFEDHNDLCWLPAIILMAVLLFPKAELRLNIILFREIYLRIRFLLCLANLSIGEKNSPMFSNIRRQTEQTSLRRFVNKLKYRSVDGKLRFATYFKALI